jgi:hypothetical protein
MQILEVVPVSGSLVLPILVRGLPNKVLSRSIQCTYLRGLLQIAEHLVSLDVEICWQDIAFSLGEHTLNALPSDAQAWPLDPLSVVSSSRMNRRCAPTDEEDEEEESNNQGGGVGEQEVDIFELEGQTEEVQLDPTRFRSQPREVERREGEVAYERVTGRGGFEGEATDNAPSTSGRPQVATPSAMQCSIHSCPVWRLQGWEGSTSCAPSLRLAISSGHSIIHFIHIKPSM